MGLFTNWRYGRLSAGVLSPAAKRQWPEAKPPMIHKLPTSCAAAMRPHLDALDVELMATCTDCVQRRCFGNDASDCGNQLCAVQRAYAALTVLRDEADRPTRPARMELLKTILAEKSAPG